MKRTLLTTCVLLAIYGQSSAIFAASPMLQESDINDDYLEDDFGDDQFGDFYGSEEFISIATGTQQAIEKAPAVASVITAEQIRQSGARNLIDALKMVPGLNISRSSQAMGPKFNFRGITSTYSPQTLLMLNGVPTKSVVRGDNHIVWGEYPINSISRIEIIRGPGSALYGADAFAGVINIITFSPEELQQAEAGAGFGSDKTHNAWFKTGFSKGDLKTGMSVEFLESDGSDETIDYDAQSPLDELARDLFDLEPVSNAPGGTNLGFRALDAYLNAEYNDFDLGISYQDRAKVGTGQGISEALDPNGKFGSYKLMIDFRYETLRLANEWKFSGHFNYYRSTQEIERNLNLLPPGTLFGAFPNGIIGNPEWKEDTTTFEIRADFSGWADHHLVLGTGYVVQDLFEVRESKNFFPDLSPNPNGLVDVSDTDEIFIPEFDRNNKFLLVQDIWQLAPDWELTAGIRYDDYSDFGSAVNPRLSLVWSSSLKSTTKFLYGRAFRAPSFAEILTVNNPVALGNPEIDPESIDSLELAYSYRHNDKHTSSINAFYYKIDDFITFVPDQGAPTSTAQNVGEISGYGLEAETGLSLNDYVSMKVNYSFVRSTDDLVEDDVGEYPNHQVKAELLWQITDSWSLHSTAAFIGKRKRSPLDQRESLSGYSDVGFNLHYTGNEGWNVSFSVDNLLDEIILEPSTGPSTEGGAVNIPGDLPLSGLTAMIKVSKQL
ncbi:TonB-dependent receptor plug domain-containing protein [Planctobacterium marinum]|uniref:TonB-dependent receptor plug domain-containing protein n=1 Tax=Planctobacterium marinum TaxID=1631968 RepID=UPI001E56824F|nr:TonB-dependent receptor [Planctobacterium marinum]MCC2604249.1 TonB-dependent receptor [Planctobacterium marinum]